MALLAPLARSGPERFESREKNFGLEYPADEWDRLDPPDSACALRLRTQFGHRSRDAAEIRIYVTGATLATVLEKWRATLESAAGDGARREEAKTGLDGVEGKRFDARGEAHVTWWVVRHLNVVYVLHAVRSGAAVGDEEVEAEIEAIRNSFVFLRNEAQAPAPSKPRPAAPDPQKLERRVRTDGHGRLEWVKPQGMVERKPREKGAFYECEARSGQSACTIRLFADSRGKGKLYRYSIERYAEAVLRDYRENEAWTRRKEPVRDADWKPPLRKRSIRLRLVGRRAVPVTELWFFAECRNDRQYRIRIVLRGGAQAEADFRPQLDDFLRGFRPVRRIR